MQHDMGFIPPALFGAGRVAEVPARAVALGARSVLVVADPFLVQSGALQGLMAGLEAAGLASATYADFAGEPKTTHVTAAARAAADHDLVIGIGGGSALDIAKSAATIAAPDADSADYAVDGRALPLRRARRAIMVPTTSGTGSESSATNILSGPDGSKLWIWGEVTKPDLVVLDPALTLSLPPHLTAWTGMDALIHAFESATNRKTHAGAQLHAHHALRLAAGSLVEAVRDGSDLRARGDLMRASFHAGIAIDNCNTAMAHAVSHALARFGPVHHGLATALGFEATLPWLVTHDTPDIRAAAAALGTTPEALPGHITAMMDACGIARALPASCAVPDAAALADEMRRPPNMPMFRATIGAPDPDRIARAVFDLVA